MLLNHVGISARSREEAIAFYKDFLGFEITKESVLPSELAVQLFDVSADIDMIVFEGHGIKIEIFVCPDCSRPVPDFTHNGLYLDNLSDFLEKASQKGVEIITGRTESKTVYFIKDFSGNLLEVKQK